MPGSTVFGPASVWPVWMPQIVQVGPKINSFASARPVMPRTQPPIRNSPRSPFSSSSTERSARASVESAAEVYGVAPVVYPLDPASGPVGALCGVRSPAVPVASFGVGYAGSNPHGPDEHVRVEDFLQGVKYFGRVIHRLAQIAREDRREQQTQELIAPNAG